MGQQGSNRESRNTSDQVSGDQFNSTDMVGLGATANTSAGDANLNIPEQTDPQSGGVYTGTERDADPLGYGDDKK